MKEMDKEESINDDINQEKIRQKSVLSPRIQFT